MATVRITDRIIRDVRYNIQQQFQNLRYAEAKKLQDTRFGLAAYNELVSPIQQKIIAQLNATSGLRYHSWFTDCGYINGAVDRFDFQAPLGGALPFPLGTHRVIFTEETPHYADAKAIVDRLREIDKECSYVQDEMCGQVLGQCTTLKQVIEHWPSIVDYLPHDVLAKHAEPVAPTVRRKRAEIDISDASKVALTKLRFLKGAVT